MRRYARWFVCSGLVSIAVVVTVPASSELPPDPACVSAPASGGTVTVRIPGATFPPACNADCTGLLPFGVPLPPTPLFGFIDDTHDRCEIKNDGPAKGKCRRDTTCPPGIARESTSDGTKVCKKPDDSKTVSCPARANPGESLPPPSVVVTKTPSAQGPLPIPYLNVPPGVEDALEAKRVELESAAKSEVQRAVNDAAARTKTISFEDARDSVRASFKDSKTKLSDAQVDALAYFVVLERWAGARAQLATLRPRAAKEGTRTAEATTLAVQQQAKVVASAITLLATRVAAGFHETQLAAIRNMK